MIGRCVGGHWPPLRLGNVQMVDKRCAEVVAPYGIALSIRLNPQVLPVITRKWVARHRYVAPAESSRYV